MNKSQVGLLAGPLVFLIMFFLIEPAGMNPAARAILAATLWIAIWWITEAVPISVTALLPIVIFPLTGGLDLKATTAAYGHPLMYLFLGGLIIAVAIERWHLHRRIALLIINRMGTDSRRIILGFMTATAFLSMWISNVATTVMMMPIGVAVIVQFVEFLKSENEDNQEAALFGKALMLCIAYSASIGGMATIIGTPPNIILTGVVKDLYNVEISFTQWMLFGLPVSIVLLGVCWYYMTHFAFQIKAESIPGSQQKIAELLAGLGKMSPEEKRVLLVFALTAFAWMTRSFLLSKIIPTINDTIIAITGAVLLFLIPRKKGATERLLDWESAVKIPWGILLLFGGGFALAAGFKSSGLAVWIGERMDMLSGVHLLIVLAVIIATVNFLTEVTSNTSTTSILLPVIASLAAAIELHPFGLMTAACLAASCAFMLPVATPPNAIVFGSGYIRMEDMVRAGVWMNLLTIGLLTLFVYYFLPYIWRIDLAIFPAVFR